MHDKLEAEVRSEVQALADGLLGTVGQAGALSQRERLVDVTTERLLGLLQGPPADGDEADAEAVELLTDLGVETLTAQQLASQCAIEEIEDWIAYARASKGLANPAGLVVSRLRRGVAAPKVGGSDGARYISGEYAPYIQS